MLEHIQVKWIAFQINRYNTPISNKRWVFTGEKANIAFWVLTAPNIRYFKWYKVKKKKALNEYMQKVTYSIYFSGVILRTLYQKILNYMLPLSILALSIKKMICHLVNCLILYELSFHLFVFNYFHKCINWGQKRYVPHEWLIAYRIKSNSRLKKI